VDIERNRPTRTASVTRRTDATVDGGRASALLNGFVSFIHSFIHSFGHAPSNHTNLAMILALIGVWVLCGLRVHTDTAGYTGRPWVGRTASVRGVDGFVG
jgi:hypothetical protein